MWHRLTGLWESWDRVAITLTLLLLALGLSELYASSLSRPDLLSLWYRQLVAAGVGLFFLIVVAGIDYRLYISWSRLTYVIILVLLIGVLFIGQTIHGTTGWIRFGGLGFQPVEFVKVLWVLVMASYLSHVEPPLTWRKTIGALVLLAPIVVLILLQPDVGSGILVMMVTAALMVVVPKSKQWWLVMILALTGLVLLAVFFLKDYQQERLQNFFNPRRDPLGTGYNVTQSIVAVGSGKIWGRGLGLGTQSQLQFLPEQHTDFIFASLAEELGFIGALLTLGLWLGLLGRMLWLLRRLRDDFAMLITVGVISLFSIQVLLNIGMNIGLAPVIGIPLPLVSFGGTSLVASLLAIGIVLNITRQHARQAPVGF